MKKFTQVQEEICDKLIFANNKLVFPSVFHVLPDLNENGIVMKCTKRGERISGIMLDFITEETELFFWIDHRGLHLSA